MTLATRFLILTAGAAFVAADAHAFVREYDTSTCPPQSTTCQGTPDEWVKNRTVVMHLSLPSSPGSFSDGFASFNDSAEDALKIWNQYLVHMQFGIDKGSILPPS